MCTKHSFLFSVDQDDLINTLKKEEIDLLQVISFVIRRILFPLQKTKKNPVIFSTRSSKDSIALDPVMICKKFEHLQMEFSLLEDIREHVLSRLSENENDRELLHFLKELTEEKTDAPTGD